VGPRNCGQSEAGRVMAARVKRRIRVRMVCIFCRVGCFEKLSIERDFGQSLPKAVAPVHRRTSGSWCGAPRKRATVRGRLQGTPASAGRSTQWRMARRSAAVPSRSGSKGHRTRPINPARGFVIASAAAGDSHAHGGQRHHRQPGHHLRLWHHADRFRCGDPPKSIRLTFQTSKLKIQTCPRPSDFCCKSRPPRAPSQPASTMRRIAIQTISALTA